MLIIYATVWTCKFYGIERSGGAPHITDHLLGHPFQKHIGCCAAPKASLVAHALTKKLEATTKIQKTSIWEGYGVSPIGGLEFVSS